nr:putative 2-oxoglutarate-dependent dioxygenase aop1.2 [Quercus suber]
MRNWMLPHFPDNYRSKRDSDEREYYARLRREWNFRMNESNALHDDLLRLGAPLVDRSLLALPRQNMHQFECAVTKIKKETNLMILRRSKYDMLQLAERNNVLNYEDYLENALSYAIQIVELEQLVKRMVFDTSGVKKYLDPCIQFYNLRFLKYSVPEMDEANVGVENHTDKTFVSILNQNEVNGLEVKTKNGDWIKMELSPSSFVVMAGEAWSNGRIHTPFHRVILKGTKEGYTVGLFSFQTGILQTPEELVDDKHPLRFKSFDTSNYSDTIMTWMMQGKALRVLSKLYVVFETSFDQKKLVIYASSRICLSKQDCID